MDNSYRDRAMMLDPKTAKSRIFVKNLPIQSCTRREVEEHFEKYGKVNGLLLQKNYSFVQFEENEAAIEAIANENGNPFMGKVLEVAAARMPLDKAALAAQRSMRHTGGGRPPGRDRSPLREEDEWRDDMGYDGYDYRGRGPSTARGYGYGDEYYQGIPQPPRQLADERTNDCEIIVHNKKQRKYAEMIERKLQSLGLTVDLLFPNESIPVTRVLANISGRGTLYAITISPQNEEMRSLTLNILHGAPEEHRNMPLDQAVSLLNQNFDAFVVAGGIRTAPKGLPLAAVTGPVVVTPHPESVQLLLNLLAQNRPLTVLQYDTLLSYLRNRRDQQVRLEVGDPAMVPTTTAALGSMVAVKEEPATAQSEQLKNRILSLMDRRLGSGAGPSWAPTPNPTPTPTSAPILSDPQVQRALDNLFQGGDLLRKINASRK